LRDRSLGIGQQRSELVVVFLADAALLGRLNRSLRLHKRIAQQLRIDLVRLIRQGLQLFQPATGECNPPFDLALRTQRDAQLDFLSELFDLIQRRARVALCRAAPAHHNKNNNCSC
jgi:hypothetical protein